MQIRKPTKGGSPCPLAEKELSAETEGQSERQAALFLKIGRGNKAFGWGAISQDGQSRAPAPGQAVSAFTGDFCRPVLIPGVLEPVTFFPSPCMGFSSICHGKPRQRS